MANIKPVANYSGEFSVIQSGDVIDTAAGGTGLSAFVAGSYLRALSSSVLELRTPAQLLADIGGLAASSYTAADVLAKLLTVDGVSSGLDADLLDGQSGAYYFQSSITGNAGTATTLQTARTISLTGPITATGVSFNGSANISLATAIADNALSIAKTSGLQTALDDRLSKSLGGIMGASIDMVFSSVKFNKSQFFSSDTTEDVVTFRRYGENHTLLNLMAPPQASWGKAKETTLALVRGDNNEYFLDLYNMDYGPTDAGNFLDYGLPKMGLRLQKRGTGVFTPFYIEYSAGLAEQRALEITPGTTNETTNDTTVTITNNLVVGNTAKVGANVIWHGGNLTFGSGLTLTGNVLSSSGGGGGGTWGSITGTLADQTDLGIALNARAALSGAAFTGAITSTSSITVSGGYIAFGSGAGYLDMNNHNITGVNRLTFADGGINEGIDWVGANNWQIVESPDVLGNGIGNMQFVSNNVRMFTVRTDGSVDVPSGALTVGGVITGSNLSGTNTGDQTSVSGNAGSATVLQTARTINGTSFNGSANITITAASPASLTAGNGLTGTAYSGSAAQTFAIGTPGTLTGATTNAVTSTSHTHALSTNLSAWDSIAPATKADLTGATDIVGAATGSPIMVRSLEGNQTAGNPQWTWVGNTGTGMRRASTNLIAFDTASLERLTISTSIDAKVPLLQQGNQVYHAGNFDPATKADLTGATFTGPVYTTLLTSTGRVQGSQNFESTSALAVFAATGTGTIRLRPDGINNTTGEVTISTAGGMSVAGNAVYHAGNLNTNTSLATGIIPINDAVSSYPEGLSYGYTSGTLFNHITMRHAGDNRVMQLLSNTVGGSTTPNLYFRASHLTTGGGGWTAVRQVWHDGNFDPANYVTKAYGGGLSLNWSGSRIVATVDSSPFNLVTDNELSGALAVNSYIWNSDDRSGVVRTTPNTYQDRGLSVAFNSGANLGIPSSYAMSLHMGIWSTFNAAYKQQQLVFAGDGSAIYWKVATSDTAWGAAVKVHTDASTDINAATLGGAAPSAVASGGTIVQRHASGYIYANYINTVANDIGGTAPTKIAVQTGTDGFLRWMTPGNFFTTFNVAGLTNPSFNGSAVTCDGWWRSTGQTGWYNSSYAVGIYAIDTTYLRSYTNKAMYASNFVSSSDIRLKDVTGDFVYNGPLQPVNFDWKKDGKSDVGFIAQWVEKNYPQFVEDALDEDSGEMRKVVAYPKLTVVLSAQLNNLESVVASQQEQINKLQESINTIMASLQGEA